ncbi:MAG: hypothetical protein DRQ88_01400 [Epsilonproteobacteria bacterium]|nr:MAG: hypothetical protein DRQ89_05470 [Campylobacterota bacterium]RLA67948.1 MAG: hypothetical protein DRQ88_01400 [Campylobacterota bacterium]
MKKYFILFLISLPLFAAPIPDACYKDAKSTFSKSVTKAIFDPRVFMIEEGMKAHKINQIRAAIKSANTGKLTYMSKLMAKNVGMKNQEFLAVIQKNPQYFCDKKNKLYEFNKIFLFLRKHKIRPKIMAKLKSIQNHCSPQAIINKLKQRGKYKPQRFQVFLTDQMKDLANGENNKFGKKIIGYDKRTSWIYNIENNFSDPLINKSQNYQYLIHGIRPTHSVGLHEYALIDAKKYLNNLTKTSLSLVNQDDTYPFTRGFGILVWLDSSALWATNKSNMASDNRSIAYLNSAFPIHTPTQIMSMRKKEKIKINNEIVAVKGTDVIGYYLFKKPGTNQIMWYLYDMDKLEVLEKACRKNNVPVIKINLTGKGFF